MNTHIHEKTRECRNCSSTFYGRLNQIYCTVRCKNDFNNALKREKKKPVKGYLDILNKNRDILKYIHDKYGESITTREELNKLGYLISYNTHGGKTENNDPVYFVMDYGIVITADEVKVVKYEN